MASDLTKSTEAELQERYQVLDAKLNTDTYYHTEQVKYDHRQWQAIKDELARRRQPNLDELDNLTLDYDGDI